MSTTAREKAEALFAAVQTGKQRALTEIEDAQRARAERAAALRELRLAKEAADKAAGKKKR